MADWGDDDLPANKRPRAQAAPGWGDDDLKPEGKGSISQPFDLSRGQSRERYIPIGSYYKDKQGNVRRNDNGDAGNPIIFDPRGRPYKADGRAKGGLRGLVRGDSGPRRGDSASVLDEIGGGLSSVVDTIPFADEAQAALATVESGLRGQIRPRYKQGENPLSGMSTLRGVGDSFEGNLKAITGFNDDFTTRRPVVSGTIKNATLAGTTFVPGGAATQVATAPTRTAMAARGAGMGALQGGIFGLGGRGSLEDRTRDAEVGAAVGAGVGGVLGAFGAGKAPTSKPKTARPPKAPDLDTMRAQKSAAYRAVDDAGVTYTPEAFDRLADDMATKLKGANLSATRHPKAADMLREIQDMKGQAPTITQLDQLRQVIRRDVANAPDEAEQFMGREMIDVLDDFISKADDSAVSQGSAGGAASAIANARDLNTRFRKVETVTDAMDSARLRAGSTGSGGNVDNATRQNLRRVLEKGRNFTPDEKDALESIVMGSKGQNVLRQVGKLSPSGNGLMAAGNLGAAATMGPIGAIPGTAGLVSKYIADRMTQQKVTQLIDLMAAGGRMAPQAENELTSLAAKDPGVSALLKDLMERAPRAAGAGASELSRYKNQPTPQNALSRAQ